MTRLAFQRDNILNDDERATSARKCIALLKEVAARGHWSRKDFSFFTEQEKSSLYIDYKPTEPQLQWVRDMVDRYT